MFTVRMYREGKVDQVLDVVTHDRAEPLGHGMKVGEVTDDRAGVALRRCDRASGPADFHHADGNADGMRLAQTLEQKRGPAELLRKEEDDARPRLAGEEVDEELLDRS